MFLPTDQPRRMVSRFKSYSKVTRMYNGFQEYAEHVIDCYPEQGNLKRQKPLLIGSKPPERRRWVEERHQVIGKK